MPAIQTSYPLYQAVAFEGMVANSIPRTVISRLVETAAGIGFGKVAVRGTADNQCRVAAVGLGFLGITIADPTQVGGTVDTYPQYAVAAIMTKGAVWVQASVAVADGDPVYFVPATGVLTNASSGNTLIPNAVWDTTTTGAGLAVLRMG